MQVPDKDQMRQAVENDRTIDKLLQQKQSIRRWETAEAGFPIVVGLLVLLAIVGNIG